MRLLRDRRIGDRRGARSPAAVARTCAATRGASTSRRRRSDRNHCVGRRAQRPRRGGGWHHGVIGIAASKSWTRTKARYRSLPDGDIAHGSCRTFRRSMLARSTGCADLFLRLGHEQAAGLTMENREGAGIPRAHQRTPIGTLSRTRAAPAVARIDGALNLKRRSPRSSPGGRPRTRWPRRQSAPPATGCRWARGRTTADQERHLK